MSEGPAPQNPAVYLVSSAGVPNYGDELITRAWLDRLARLHPHTDVWLDCIEPGRAAHLFDGVHPRLRTTNTLWDLAHKGRSNDPVSEEDEIRRVVRELGSPRIDAGLEMLRGVRSVHFLGGGYLNSLWARNLHMVTAASELKRRFGTEVYLTGQGFLPQNESTGPWLRVVLAEFDYVESRDSEGAQELGVPFGLDDAYLALAEPRPVFRVGPTPRAMVLLQGDFPAEDREQLLLKAATDFIDRHAPDGDVGVVEALPPDDAFLLAPLRERYPRLTFYPFADIWRHGLPARAGQVWLTSRFHPHLMAAVAGAAGTALRVHPGYYDIKHGSLLERGTGWSVTDVGVDADPQRNELFVEHVAQFAQEKSALADRLYPRVDVTGIRSAMLRLRHRTLLPHAARTSN